MMTHLRSAGALLLLLGVPVLLNVSPASARGGGSNIMNSPGYQRALQESRKQYQPSAVQPHVPSPSAHNRKTSGHRHRH
jgi:hypothetical protein